MSDEFDDDIQQVPSRTPDFRTDLAEELARLAPEAVADGKIDVEKLRELLDADSADDGRERFGLMWPGKSRALKAAQAPTTATLLPDRETSKDWDTTHNVFIEGDNLEVLKILQKHYHGKIKMIYIDPPYNTGNDFIYPDNYKEGLHTYLEWTSQVSEDGKKLSSNPESAGRYHSNWLNMMYPRLKLAKNLLSDDGVILISIDETELSSLKALCDQSFGEQNFVAVAPRKTGAGSAATRSEASLRKLNDFVLVYRKSDSGALARKIVGEKDYPNSDESGTYRLGQFQASGSDATRRSRPNMWFEIFVSRSGELSLNSFGEDSRVLTPEKVNGEDGRWLWSRQKFDTDQKKFLVFDGRKVHRKIYYDSAIDQKIYQVEKAWFEGFTNAEGTKATSELFGGKKLFDHPKPVSLITHLLRLVPGKDFTALDFFTGSATTAHAVMQLNAEDGGSRRHIQVQLPEPVDSDSEAGKAGFSTIADIARERIRRAGEKIKEELSEQLSTRETPLDVGFRSYKLSDTSFVKWKETSNTGRNALEERLAGLRGSADDDATPETLLTELLLKQGYSLTEDVSEIEIAGLKVWSVADGALLAIMNEHIKPSLDQLRAVVEAGPVRLVILEDALAGDDQLKTNLVQHAKTHAVELWTS